MAVDLFAGLSQPNWSPSKPHNVLITFLVSSLCLPLLPFFIPLCVIELLCLLFGTIRATGSELLALFLPLFTARLQLRDAFAGYAVFASYMLITGM